MNQLNIEIFDKPTRNLWDTICSRPADDNKKVMAVVKDIFAEVERSRDLAVQTYNAKYDKNNANNFLIDQEIIQLASNQLSQKLKDAIAQARQNIYAFHQAQQQNDLAIEVTPGVTCQQITKPIERVGLYIPGGTAPLLSTVLMLGIPANIAGCKEIILCTPADENGKVDPAILYTASLVGVTEIYGVGGAQAIAAMHYGTETIPKVDKIFGPGNQYVTTAKQYAQQLGTAIDMPAGPSELLIMAGKGSIPAFVAADLLSQAEHGIDSQVVCVVDDISLIEPIQKELMLQLKRLPRKSIAGKALENSAFVYLSDINDRIDFINQYAPEHYIICAEEEQFYMDGLTNAGSVFLGNYSPESAGDYASGTNHTLPTSGFAKAYSGVNLGSFTKQITVQKLTSKGLQVLGNTVIEMANAEQLHAHAHAIQVRLDYLQKSQSDV